MDSPSVLYGTAVSIALVHTLFGPDHYLPFIAMSRAGGWSLAKTVVVTVLCGIGHVLSSVLIGVVGIVFGVAVLQVESVESFRSELAGFMMIGFGLIYGVWGARHALRNKPHTHWHVHTDGTVHEHEHVHTHEHLHIHTINDIRQNISGTLENRAATTSEMVVQSYAHADESMMCTHHSASSTLTPWILFTIFLFGPCEWLIPLLIYPAAMIDFHHVAGVILVFGVTTIATMTLIVTVVHFSLNQVVVQHVLRFRLFQRFNRYGHALAGFVVLLCRVAMLAGY